MNIDTLTKLISANPENELFHFSLAQAYMAEDRMEEALEEFTICLTKNNEWMVVRILQGKALKALGKTSEAKTVLEESLRLAIDQHHESPQKEINELLASL